MSMKAIADHFGCSPVPVKAILRRKLGVKPAQIRRQRSLKAAQRAMLANREHHNPDASYALIGEILAAPERHQGTSLAGFTEWW